MKTTILRTLMIPLLLVTFTLGVSRAESREVVLFNTPDPYIDEDPTIADRMPSRPIIGINWKSQLEVKMRSVLQS